MFVTLKIVSDDDKDVDDYSDFAVIFSNNFDYFVYSCLSFNLFNIVQNMSTSACVSSDG